jgi:hypothetical protein
VAGIQIGWRVFSTDSGPRSMRWGLLPITWSRWRSGGDAPEGSSASRWSCSSPGANATSCPCWETTRTGCATWRSRGDVPPCVMAAARGCAWKKCLRACARLLKSYLRKAPGARAHIPVDKDAPLAEFERVSPRFPVFEVVAGDGV